MRSATVLSGYSLTQYLIGWIAVLWCIYIWKVMYRFCIRYVKLMKAAKKFPGPPAIPLLGNAWEFAKNIDDTLEIFIQISKEYPTCRVWIGPQLFVFLTNPKHIEIVLKSHKTSKKSFVYELMAPLFVNSLLNGHGPKMRANRKLLVPLINGEYLMQYMNTFNRQIRTYVNVLANKEDEREFDIYKEIANCIADIAFETVFGIPGVAQSHGDMTIPHAVETLAQLFFRRVVSPWLHSLFIFNHTKYGRVCETATSTIHEFIYNLIKEKRKLHEALLRSEPAITKPKPSILDLWMENVVKSNAMNDYEIANDLITLFIGFYHTIVGTDDDILDEHIGELQYTQMAIRETIRLFPVGPILAREVSDDLEIDEYTLPKGSTVAIIAAVTHRSEQLWDEPDKFFPERLSPEYSSDRHPYAYIPFSGGSRICPGIMFGMTCLKVLVAQVIRKCQLMTSMKFECMKLKTYISVRSQDGYRVSIKKIDYP